MMRLLQLYPNASSATNTDSLQEAAQGAGCTCVWCKQVSLTEGRGSLFILAALHSILESVVTASLSCLQETEHRLNSS